jgi:lipopolysaccharide biosynthesis regulator YciM
MTDAAILATILAAIAGLAAGRAWASALHRGERRFRTRSSSHYTLGLHQLASGRPDLAASELAKVSRAEPSAVEVHLVLGDLFRESGQVERALTVHQGLLARPELGRSERVQALVCLALDLRKAGFLDRATRTFEEALDEDPRNIHALAGLERLLEDQRRWRDAADLQARIGRLRKATDNLVLGFLRAQVGQEAMDAGRAEEAEREFKEALALDRRVFPARLGLADLRMEADPRRAAAILEEAAQETPERAYLVFDRLLRAYDACRESSRFAALCERMIRQDPGDWRARLALARRLRGEGRADEALGLLLRAMESNPHILVVHLEAWRTLRALAVAGEAFERYTDAAERSVAYRDPHICTVCRYRADDMLWRCPHCHAWNAFVEERVGLSPDRQGLP